MRIVQVDAFTDTPFSGNPAAVCVLDRYRDDVWMQQVAREMNLSETAFLTERDEGYDLRWFTPEVEVELCGHATLASAHVLWEDKHVKRGRPIAFHTQFSGVLTATQDGRWIELDFPSQPASGGDAPLEVVVAVGGHPVTTIGGNVGGGFTGYLFEYATEHEVRALHPNSSELARRKDGYVIATAPSDDSEFDFVSRFFAAPAGIVEDPVTGSAHCVLGPWWGEKLQKSELLAYQCSARGGIVRMKLKDDRVILGGKAVTVFRGELL